MSWLFGENDTVKTASGMVQKLIADLHDAETKLKTHDDLFKEKDASIEQFQEKLSAATDRVTVLEGVEADLKKQLIEQQASHVAALKEKDLLIARLRKRLQQARDVLDLQEELKIIGEKIMAAQDLVKDDETSRPIVLAGPSGVGKGTLIQRLMEEYPLKFGFSISHTTRNPRPGEKNGVQYHFVTKEEFEKLKPDMIEWAAVHNNMYGTSTQAVRDVISQGKVCILDIDVQGAEAVKRTNLNPFLIFIKPPSLEILEKRLRGRGTETEEAIQNRLKNAQKELDASTKPGLFEKILVNDDLEVAYKELKAAIASTGL
mmetsp:Transcript_45825/g.74774  ORF Transcript_45825/g.74774 Transcript_45825/m.74774 type:complete len:317 (-) Transcript_45825:129-1079(-)|eukprot:CAMPEP_0184646030 /NCGR_PEP_ID=MMETSP0308-20130426/2685_1 /TAXON_ID=38269 /ORGANISM="Gloeochaete witrockiana, Strain SAG 46.84" /LENGTH=316 /DNA_ID=CAMNT_0027075683 /DNA_START=171 /DNA_END=1121 /DNA_ORIENTATION=-